MNRDDAMIVKLWENAQQSHPVKYADGSTRWVLPNGDFHREDGPAVIFLDGSKWWYQNNKLHRIGGPAIEDANGDEEWYMHGKAHRTDGPAFVYASAENAAENDDEPAEEDEWEQDRNDPWWVQGKSYKDVYDWAKAALEYEGVANASEEQVDHKVMDALAQDVLN